jgi:hypothetical protein
MSVLLDRGVRVQIYLRQGRPVVRAVPATAEHPTEAQAMSRLMFGVAARVSRFFTVEEVAMLVGGQVVEVNGRKMIRMPDGRLLLKQMAFVKWFMEGYRTGLAKPRPEPEWLSQLEAKHNMFYRLLYNARVHPGKPTLISSQTAKSR